MGKWRRRGCHETRREEERLSKEIGGTKRDRAEHIRKKSSAQEKERKQSNRCCSHTVNSLSHKDNIVRHRR